MPKIVVALRFIFYFKKVVSGHRKLVAHKSEEGPLPIVIY
jgi:hypothetical protein